MDRETEEPKSDLCLAIFQVDNVGFGSEIDYCARYQGVSGLSQSASAAQRVAKSTRRSTYDFDPEV